ncbi:MAG: class I SAM-dependent methyltransferase [Pseudohongiellaceae bacterium]
MAVQTAQYTDGTYLERVTDWHLGDAAWKADKVYRMLHKHSLSPATVADVGCGAGGVLAELQKKLSPETVLTGFDVSPQAIAMAKKQERGHLTFYQQDFLVTPTPTLPELILLLDVFEHVPDYLGFLQRLRARSDWILFHIPLDICAKEVLQRSRYPLHMRQQFGHLHYFTRETALATLEDTGYTLADHEYTDDMEIDQGAGGKLKSRLSRKLRRHLFRYKPRFAAALFDHFNLLVLARGDRRAGESVPRAQS